MADATTPQPTSVRTSKRKRNQVSYLADDYYDALEADEDQLVAEDDVVDSDPEDSAFGTRRGRVKRRTTKKAKKAAPAKKEKKQKPFRFLDLPPELRDEIYELALVEPNGLTLVSRTKAGRRGVARGAIHVQDSQNYYGKVRRRRWWRWHNVNQSQTSFETHHDRTLVPNLLAVCQQIRAEATSFLYKQEIVLEDTTALLQFIATIGPHNRQVINDIVVRGWGSGRGVTRGHNFSALTMLASCTNLDSLYFDCTVGWYWRSSAKKLAGQIYRDGHHFLESYASVNGLDAALKVVQFGDRQFAKDPTAKELEFDETKRDEFEKELAKLMKKGSGL